MGEWHNTFMGLTEDHVFCACCFNPIGELLMIVEGGGQHHHLDVVGEHHDTLFPYVAAIGRINHMNLVENHGAEVVVNVDVEC